MLNEVVLMYSEHDRYHENGYQIQICLVTKYLAGEDRRSCGDEINKTIIRRVSYQHV